MRTRILALDPGGTTGIAQGAGAELYATHEMEQYEALVYVDTAIEGWPDLGLVVAESFVPRPGIRTWQPAALEIIGTVRYLCATRGITFEEQTPAAAKSFATDAKLRKLGWYTPGMGHANDAARHLLVAQVRHRSFPMEALDAAR